jgi:outer membrane murein-binding lipoprotein Lpp
VTQKERASSLENALETLVPLFQAHGYEVDRQVLNQRRIAVDLGHGPDITNFNIYRNGHLIQAAVTKRKAGHVSKQTEKQYKAALKNVRDLNRKVAKLETELTRTRSKHNVAHHHLNAARQAFEEDETQS